MARPTTTNPTEGELAILGILWRHGAQTVTEIRQNLPEADVRKQSVQVRLRIMIEKGYVRRLGDAPPRTYVANVQEQTTKQRVLRGLMQRLFGGSAKNMVLHALDAKKATPDEVREIRRRLDELERGS